MPRGLHLERSDRGARGGRSGCRPLPYVDDGSQAREGRLFYWHLRKQVSSLAKGETGEFSLVKRQTDEILSHKMESSLQPYTAL